MTAIDLTRSFAITRHFSVPPAAVFAAFTDPQKLGWFFNPGFISDLPVSVDLRPGGAWRQEMIVNDQTRYITGGIYRHIEAPHRLDIAWGAVDGWPEIDPDDLDAGPQVHVVFTPEGAGTRMVFTVALPENMAEAEVRDWLGTQMQDGWAMTLARLEAELA